MVLVVGVVEGCDVVVGGSGVPPRPPVTRPPVPRVPVPGGVPFRHVPPVPPVPPTPGWGAPPLDGDVPVTAKLPRVNWGDPEWRDPPPSDEDTDEIPAVTDRTIPMPIIPTFDTGDQHHRRGKERRRTKQSRRERTPAVPQRDVRVVKNAGTVIGTGERSPLIRTWGDTARFIVNMPVVTVAVTIIIATLLAGIIHVYAWDQIVDFFTTPFNVEDFLPRVDVNLPTIPGLGEWEFRNPFTDEVVTFG